MWSSNFHIYLFHFLILIYGYLCSEDGYKLNIFSSTQTNLTHIDESVNNSLDLICQLEGFYKGLNANLSWQLPKYKENRIDAILIDYLNGSLQLTLNQLNVKDSGVYVCVAVIDQEILEASIIVHVKNKPCVNMFECSPLSDRCIPHRYVCDGIKDCDSGLDESPLHCGEDVCKGKNRCSDGRCYPASWCCQPLEPNCTVRIRYSCCPPLEQDDYLLHQNILNQQHYTEMTFLQSTIYTIVGFAMVFMSIVTILMICICRIHLQRSLLSSVPRRQPRTSSPNFNITPSSRPGADRDAVENSRMFVSYSIPTNGLEIVDEICQPPPYSEVTLYSDPPPSYKDIFNTRTDEDSETSPCLSSEKPPP